MPRLQPDAREIEEDHRRAREAEHVARITPLLREWSEDDSADKLTITLDHQYTEKGLTPDMLKGTDRARVRILQEAVRQADCKAYLGC